MRNQVDLRPSNGKRENSNSKTDSDQLKTGLVQTKRLSKSEPPGEVQILLNSGRTNPFSEQTEDEGPPQVRQSHTMTIDTQDKPDPHSLLKVVDSAKEKSLLSTKDVGKAMCSEESDETSSYGNMSGCSAFNGSMYAGTVDELEEIDQSLRDYEGNLVRVPTKVEMKKLMQGKTRKERKAWLTEIQNFKQAEIAAKVIHEQHFLKT